MQLENNKPSSLPLRFVDLKRSIVPQDEDSRARLIASWNELLGELRTAVEEIKAQGSSVSSCTLHEVQTLTKVAE